MAKYAFVWTLCVLLFSSLLVYAEEPAAATHIEAAAEFPGNPFGLIVNGQRNLVVLSLTNKGDPSTVVSVSGRVAHADNPNKILRNLAPIRQTAELESKTPTQVPFAFFSEFPPGEVELTVFVDLIQDEKLVRLVGFKGIVAVTDPEISLFEPQMLFLYVVLAITFYGIGYVIYQAFFDNGRKSKTSTTKSTLRPKQTDDKGNTVVDESWLPKSPNAQSPGSKTKRRSARNK